MKKNGVKVLSCTLATGVLMTSIPLSVAAAPISGVVGMASTDTGMVQESSYSTLAGVSLTMSKILAESTAAKYEVAANDTVTVEQQNQAQQSQIPQDQTQQAPQSEYANIAIAQVNNYVNVRSVPSEEGEVLGKLYNNSAATVQGTEGDWLHITSGSVDGYVKAQYVVVGDENLARAVSRRVATVNTQTLYVRTQPSTEASVLGMVPGGDDLTVTDESTSGQGWVKVSVEEGEGYVSTQYVGLSTEYTFAESKAEEEARLAREEAERQKAAEAAKKKQKKKSSSSSKSSGSKKSYSSPSGSGGSSVANYATQFVGNPYVYGGSSLTNGADCSGFVMSVYRAFGVSLPHSSSALRSVGYGVSQSEMQAGDIVCYSGHVGIYIGGGQIVHASNKRDGIKISNAGYRKILAVRRIF